MKKHLILAGVFSVAIVQSQPAMAVTKCVALNSSTTCTSSSSQYQSHPDWAATCTTNGVSTPISGIGICSSTDGGSMGDTALELNISSASEENIYCWCKMTSPAVSRWVFNRSLWSVSDCARDCTKDCVDLVKNIESFRSALFGSLSD